MWYAGKRESDMVCEGASQWCVKGLGWTVLCICAGHLTRWLVRRATAEAAHVDLQIFSSTDLPIPTSHYSSTCNRNSKLFSAPFPLFIFPQPFSSWWAREGVEYTVLLLCPGLRASSEEQFVHVLRLGSRGVLGKQNLLPSISRQNSGAENLVVW